LYLPVLMLAFAVMGSVGASGLVTDGVCGLLLVSFSIYAVSSEFR